MSQTKTLELLEWPRLCQHLSTYAATKLGRVAAQQLSIPATSTQSLALLQQTQEVQEFEDRVPAGLSFEGIYDIQKALERSQRQGILRGEELLQVATTLAGSRNLRRLIDRQPDLKRLGQLVAGLRTYPELEQAIRHQIDERGTVADRASVKLAQIRSQQRQVRDQIYQILQGILRRTSAVQENLITQRSDRFVIPVKAPQKEAVPGIIHDTSTSGATLYVEPQGTVNLNNQLRQLQRQEQAEAEVILQALTQQVAEVQPDLVSLLDTVTILDLATARSRYSRWLGANAPRFIEPAAGETITLRQLRHPLLVWQHQHEQGPAVVPIDLQIQPQTRVVAITGPNTGGKTVTLKTLGLIALMAKAGLFVPAREPVELPWFDQVLADIGDEQSLEQSLSTFSSHIRRICQIIEQASDRSLVLLDEVGAGTDPSEGSALAIALLQYLADHVQLTVATTHFGELKALKYQDPRFENASVEFDERTLTPTYRLLWGIPGRSNAMAIARRLGLRSEILAQAAVEIGHASEDVNQVIAGLEDQRRGQETKTQAAAQLLAQTETLHRQVAQKAADLQAHEQQLQQQQTQAVQAAIHEAKQEIAQVIRQLQQGPATAQRAGRATQAVDQVAQQYLPAGRQPSTPPARPKFHPQPGTRVRIPSLGQTAEVIQPPNDDGTLTVRFGLMKMTVNLAEIESLTGEKAEPIAKPKPTPEPSQLPASSPSFISGSAPAVRTAENTLDLRGSRVADAELVLDQAIANACGPLWIIHGHGTGKLRKGVQAFLDQHPRIQRHEAAQQAEGGTGVTIAYPAD